MEQLSVFWVSVDSIDPNPFQPRQVFNDDKILGLSQSIKRYGVLQPLVVTKREEMLSSGDMSVRYELIAGERRLRAAKLAGVREVPVVVRADTDDNVRLELAIIENLQREDLTPIDRARAFKRLADEFDMKHTQIAEKVGRSREYVSNSIRLLSLSDDIVQAIQLGKMSEGHARALLMLCDKPEEQRTLFQDIMLRKLTVRETEHIARKTAMDRVRKAGSLSENKVIEEHIGNVLGARVYIQEKGDAGGKITIDCTSKDTMQDVLQRIAHLAGGEQPAQTETDAEHTETMEHEEETNQESDREDDMYSFKNFSL